MATSREIWGPQTWRFLHLLASISDRKDAFALWIPMLRSMSHILPCELCRQHMGQYVLHHRITLNPITTTGVQVKDEVQRYLWAFHNSVNTRLGKSVIAYEDLTELYDSKPRAERLTEISALYGLLCEHFRSRRSPTIYTLWQSQCRFLFSLLASGPS